MSFFTRLSRPARLSLGASWLAVGAAGTYYADEWEHAVYKLTGRSAPVDSTSRPPVCTAHCVHAVLLLEETSLGRPTFRSSALD